MGLPTTVSESTRRLNPQLFGRAPVTTDVQALLQKKRIRQDSAGLNKTEQRLLAHLQQHFNPELIMPHGITLKLANGCKYTPDFFVKDPRGLRAYEAKGAHAWDDAIVKLKVAASQNRWLTFYLASPVDRSSGQWNFQQIIP